MWGRIAKAVDVAMSAEAPGKIEDYQIEHIVEAILDCAPPKTQLQAARRSSSSQENAIQASTPVSPPNKSESWANVAAQNTPKAPKAATKPSLKQPFRGMQADSRIMIRLGENSPHRNEHPFLLQKKANAVLSANVVIGKVAHVNSGLALIPALGTDLEQLEENASRLAQAFGACRAKRNEKWAIYLVQEVPKRIMTLDGLTDVTTEMAEQAFKMSCGMKLEWARWSVQ